MITTGRFLKPSGSVPMNGQIKIQEIWKAINVIDYPIQVAKQVENDHGPSTRATTNGRLIENGYSCLSLKKPAQMMLRDCGTNFP